MEGELEGDSKGDLETDLKQDIEGHLLSSRSGKVEVRSGPGLVQFTAQI